MEMWNPCQRGGGIYLLAMFWTILCWNRRETAVNRKLRKTSARGAKQIQASIYCCRPVKVLRRFSAVAWIGNCVATGVNGRYGMLWPRAFCAVSHTWAGGLQGGGWGRHRKAGIVEITISVVIKKKKKENPADCTI
jgi:hypothetical protein